MKKVTIITGRTALKLGKAFTIVLLFISITACAQDTIFVKTFKVPYNILVSKKTGLIEKVWWRKVKVQSGYIIKYADSTYAINGKMLKMYPGQF